VGKSPCYRQGHLAECRPVQRICSEIVLQTAIWSVRQNQQVLHTVLYTLSFKITCKHNKSIAYTWETPTRRTLFIDLFQLNYPLHVSKKYLFILGGYFCACSMQYFFTHLWVVCPLTRCSLSGFGGLGISMLASGTQVRGFKPGRSRWIFKGGKLLSMPSFRREVKPWVPCPRFVACKRSLNVLWKSAFRQNYQSYSPPISSNFRR
jgi:hypothetical protein